MQKPAALSVEAAAATGGRSRSAGVAIDVNQILYGATVAIATASLLL